MLLHFTDALTGSSVAINPKQVIAIFTAPTNTEIAGKTVINIPSGTIAVTEDYLTVCGRMNGELND
jgi:hypothetical protein